MSGGQEASVLSQKFVEEFSPGNGRDRVAHGASHGSMRPAHTPLPPSPAAAGEGGEWGRGAVNPRLTPWATVYRPCRGYEA